MSPVPPLRPHPAALPLCRPEDAVSVVLTASCDLDRPATVLLLLDAHHRGIGCVVLRGTGPVRAVVETVRHLVALEPGIRALVLASARGPGGDRSPTADERARFPVLRQVFADAGVDLLDWFVTAGLHAASLCELTDGQWRWRAPAPGVDRGRGA